jgi:hypothetical protein
MLIYWDFLAGVLFLCPAPFFWGMFSVPSDSLLSVCYDDSLFFNFVGQFDFECYSLAQKMSSVIHYLPCFREWLVACPLSVFVPFWPSFTNISSLLFPLSPVHFHHGSFGGSGSPQFFSM